MLKNKDVEKFDFKNISVTVKNQPENFGAYFC
jgi:hypothetical protein